MAEEVWLVGCMFYFTLNSQHFFPEMQGQKETDCVA